MKIGSAVIPAAGYGTRFLPYTKAIPKEMLPLLNTPAIHMIIQEGLQAHINNFFFITGKEKQAINNYFEPNPELEQFLETRGKRKLLEPIDHLIAQAHFSFISQPNPRGLGHAILMAKDAIIEPYFGIMLPDDIIVSDPGALLQLLDVARHMNVSVIAVKEVPASEVSSYGVIAPKSQLSENLFEVAHLVEKPQPSEAPSNMAIIGRYVLSRSIFDSLEQIPPSHGGEIQLTDGIAHMLHQNERVIALKISGERLDVGTPMGWIKAVVSLALAHPEYGIEIKRFMHDKLNS